MEWKKVKLGEVAVSIQTGPFGSQLHESDYSSDGIPVIMPKDIINWRVSDNSIARVDEEHINRLSRHKVKYEDIVYPRRGDVGKCALITKEQNNWLCGTGCMKIEINKEFAFPSFIFYQLQQWDVRKWIEKNATGATMPNLNTSIVARIPLSLPPLPYQRRISSILSDYDSLIENYQRQISLLEESAKRIYKEWFVDFKFPGVEMAENGLPKGWQKKKLGEIISKEIGGGWGKNNKINNFEIQSYVIRGTDIPSIMNGNIDNVPFRYHTASNLKERLLTPNDIIFEVSGGSETEPVGRTLYISDTLLNSFNNNVICASFCKSISFKTKEEAIIAYHTIRYRRSTTELSVYEKKSAGKIINFQWQNFLQTFEIIIPSQDLINKVFDVFMSNYDKIINLTSQIRLLRQNRDILLPRLMNGEIEIEG